MPRNDPSTLRRLGPGDVEAASAVLAEAFRRDPFFAWMLEGLERDPGTSRRFHAFTLRYGIRYGRAYAPGPGLEGAAIWLPSDKAEMTTWRLVRSGVLGLADLPFPDRAERSRFIRRMREYGAYSGGLHHRLAPFPHRYLLAIGVADAFRGTGVAGRLLRPVLRELDAEGLPCYLETHNGANVPLYGHFGFRVAEEGRLPGSDRPHWAMLRDPGAAAQLPEAPPYPLP